MIYTCDMCNEKISKYGYYRFIDPTQIMDKQGNFIVLPEEYENHPQRDCEDVKEMKEAELIRIVRLGARCRCGCIKYEMHNK